MKGLSLNDCETIISKVDGAAKLSVVSFEISPYSDSTLGFSGEHYKLRILCENKDQTKIHRVFFMKTIPRASGEYETYIQKMGVFAKEAQFYQDIVPALGLEHSGIAPSCFLVGDSYLVFEDLKEEGFCSHDGYFWFGEWKLILGNLAKLHAASVIYEEANDCRLDAKFPKALREATFSFDLEHPRGKWLRTASEAVVDCLAIFLDENPHLFRKNERRESGENYGIANVQTKFLEFISEELRNFLAPSSAYRNVINHADLWRNNILFKVDSECDLDWSKAVLLDFQLIRYVPAAFDLVTSLVINSDYEFLKKNWNVLLEHYYQYFSEYLEDAKFVADHIMPKETFFQSVEDYKRAGVVEAALFGTIVFISEDLSWKFTTDEQVFTEFMYTDRSRYVCEEYKKNRRFRERFDQLIKHLLDVFEL